MSEPEIEKRRNDAIIKITKPRVSAAEKLAAKKKEKEDQIKRNLGISAENEIEVVEIPREKVKKTVKITEPMAKVEPKPEPIPEKIEPVMAKSEPINIPQPKKIEPVISRDQAFGWY